MKKLLCTSLALLMVLSGVTVAFAAGSPAAATVSESTDTATSAAIGTNASTSSAIDVKTTGSAIDVKTTDSAIDANSTTSPAIDKKATDSAIDTNATDSAITSDSAVRNIVPDMTFTGTPIKLSLQDASKKILNDSPGKTVAELNKKDALAISEGYVENIQDLNDAAGQIPTKKARAVQRALRDYAKTQAEPNYQAELNKLQVDTMTNYYQLKQLEDLEKIAQETLDLKEKLLTNTQLKYKLGVVAKSDVLQAESAVNSAKDSLFTAQNNLRLKKMAFNTFMGYDLMQNVTLTDSLKQVDLPAKTLESSIKDAIANRNEIKAASFGLNVANLTLNVYSEYPTFSSSYLKAKIAIVEGEKAVHDANDGIEMDVRSKYMNMKQKHTAIQSGQKTVENAKEGLRLVQLQYDAGMATLTDVNTAQIAYNQSEVALSNNMLDYNLAVEAYNYASGVGTTTAPIQ